MSNIATTLAIMDARAKYLSLVGELQALYLKIYAFAPDQYGALQAILEDEDRAALTGYCKINDRLMMQVVAVMRLLPQEKKP